MSACHSHSLRALSPGLRTSEVSSGNVLALLFFYFKEMGLNGFEEKQNLQVNFMTVRAGSLSFFTCIDFFPNLSKVGKSLPAFPILRRKVPAGRSVLEKLSPQQLSRSVSGDPSPVGKNRVSSRDLGRCWRDTWGDCQTPPVNAACQSVNASCANCLSLGRHSGSSQSCAIQAPTRHVHGQRLICAAQATDIFGT
jgi:hypothetical protein